jgi:hypothetical protein
MKSTENIRRQHEDLWALGQALTAQVAAEGLGDRITPIRVLLARLASRLRIHASTEEQVLYAGLLAHPEPTVRARARSVQAEFGPFYEAFVSYTKRWVTASAVLSAQETFVRETVEVIGLLEQCIKKEEELYPFADASAPAAGSQAS